MQLVLNSVRGLMIGALVIFAVTPVLATSYAPPKRQVIQSPEGRFELVVDPQTKIHAIRSTRATKTLWTFKRSVWHDDWFVSPDGRRVVVVKWQFCKTDELQAPAVEVYHQGRLERAFSYRTLSKPRRYKLNEIGPIGWFWRVWREDAWQKDWRVYIETAGRNVIHIDTKGGTLLNGA